MEDEVEKTQYKRLLDIRNNYIRSLAQIGCSSEAIALLFNLSSSYISQLIKDYSTVEHRAYPADFLYKKREDTIKDLKLHKFSDEDISVIFYRGSLEKSNNNLKDENAPTFFELENKKLKQRLNDLNKQNNQLVTDNKNSTNKLTLLEQKYSALDTDLIIEQMNNKKLKEQLENQQSLKSKNAELSEANMGLKREVDSMKSELENLQSLKSKNAELSEANNELKHEVESLDSQLQDSYKNSRDLKILNQNLINENSELQSLSSSLLYMQADLSEKLNTIQSLNLEIASLKSELENLTTSSEQNTKYVRVYTDSQRQQMIDIYLKNMCKRKQSWQQVRNIMQINISESHFVRILQAEGVFRETYHKSKKKHKKP